MRRAAAAVAIAGILIVPSSAEGTIRPGRFAIGDSVMLGAGAELRSRGIGVSAKVSRQFDDALALIRSLKRDGKLRRSIIIHLGTNGVLIDPRMCRRIVRTAGRRRTVYLVTIKIERWYRDDQNRRLRRCANRHRRAHLVDWWSFSVDHPGWFARDGYHLTPRGQRRYATFLDRRTS